MFSRIHRQTTKRGMLKTSYTSHAYERLFFSSSSIYCVSGGQCIMRAINVSLSLSLFFFSSKIVSSGERRNLTRKNYDFKACSNKRATEGRDLCHFFESLP